MPANATRLVRDRHGRAYWLGAAWSAAALRFDQPSDARRFVIALEAADLRATPHDLTDALLRRQLFATPAGPANFHHQLPAEVRFTLGDEIYAAIPASAAKRYPEQRQTPQLQPAALTELLADAQLDDTRVQTICRAIGLSLPHTLEHLTEAIAQRRVVLLRLPRRAHSAPPTLQLLPASATPVPLAPAAKPPAAAPAPAPTESQEARALAAIRNWGEARRTELHGSQFALNDQNVAQILLVGVGMAMQGVVDLAGLIWNAATDELTEIAGEVAAGDTAALTARLETVSQAPTSLHQVFLRYGPRVAREVAALTQDLYRTLERYPAVREALLDEIKKTGATINGDQYIMVVGALATELLIELASGGAVHAARAAKAGVATAKGAGGLTEVATALRSLGNIPEPNLEAPTNSVTGNPGSNPAGDVCPSTSKTCTGGEPISLVTGEELLTLTDFEFSGRLPYHFSRTYRSANPNDAGLGHGWTHSFSEWLEASPVGLSLHTHEGRAIALPELTQGQQHHNQIEGFRFRRLDATTLQVQPEGGPTRLFTRFESGHYRLTRLQDAFGNHLALHYQDERLSHISNELGDKWVLTYTACGRIEHIYRDAVDPDQRLASFVYSDAGDLVEASDAEGLAEHYAYQHHLIQKRTLKSGYSFHFEWDSNDHRARCVRQWGDPIDGVATYDYRFEWNPAARRVAMTDSRGGVQIYQFSPLGLPIYHRDAEGGVTRSLYDSAGRLLAVTHPGGARESFDYNPSGHLIRHRTTDGKTIQLQRDSLGRLTHVKDPTGQQWQRSYGEQGELLESRNPLGETTRYRYDERGQLNAVTDPLGHTTTLLRDHRGRVSAVRLPGGAHIRYRYDDRDRLLAITPADSEPTRYRYGESDRVSEVTNAAGTIAYEYNALGLVSRVTDAAGRVTRYQYDGLSQIKRRVDPAGGVLTYHYDGERNLIGLTNEKNERYSLDYDLNERLIEEIGFDGRVQRYAYDPRGHLIQSQDLSPDTTTVYRTTGYQRDAAGRLLAEYLGDDPANILNQYHYDAAGRLTGARNEATALKWVLDAAGRVIEDHQGEQILRHRLDPAGRRIATTLPGGERLDYRFAPNGALTEMRYNGAPVVGIERDELGREIKRQHANRLTTESYYDPQGRLNAQRVGHKREAGFKAISARRYRYGETGLLTDIQDALRGNIHYEYDRLDRLTRVSGPDPEALIHDPAGNLLASLGPETPADQANTQRGKASGNRLHSFAGNNYRYDTAGNRIEQTGQDGTSRYRFDGKHQLTAVTRATADGEATTQYQYDPLGRRIHKQTTDPSGKTHSTHFLWLDDTLLSERTQAPGQPQKIRTYLFEPNSFKPVALAENGALYHYHLDHLGTPQEITDAHGKIVWAVRYRAYGNLAKALRFEIDNPLRFQGQYFDEETGLHYNRFRYYDPGCGRFINQDPIGLLGGTNSYRYVPNPVGWVDPLGLTSKEIPSVCPQNQGNASANELQNIRRAYIEEIYQIENAINAMRDVGHDWEFIARRAHQMRRDIGSKYKHLTPLKQRMQIYLRNVAPRSWTFLNEPIFFGQSILPPSLKPQGYDSILGPSAEWLREKKGKSWEEIAQSAADPNVRVSRSLGIEPNDVRKKLGLKPLEK